jgi:xanthine dehydrogenase YagS FAD-binding subunit
VAVHPSDAVSALIALGATVRLRGSSGERTVAVEELFAEPTEERRTETVLQPDELLLDVSLPAPSGDARSTYLKAMDRKVWAFALVGVAAMLRLDGHKVAEVRIVLSGVAPIPWRARDAERALTGQEATPERLAQAAETALEGARPLEHNGYKVPLARNLIRRALTDLAG